MKLLDYLDEYDLDDPDNNEGHVEDVCDTCDRRIVDHPGRQFVHPETGETIGNGSAKWPHRRAALAASIRELPEQIQISW